MSDNWLTVIPTDPYWQPDEPTVDATVKVLQRFVPAANRIEVVEGTSVEFVDAGENFLSVCCPHCGAESTMDWWIGAMDRAADRGFTDLATEVSCCGARVSLNDLDYDWPQGFTRWRIRVLEPNRLQLERAEIQTLAATLDHPIRVIYTRY